MTHTHLHTHMHKDSSDSSQMDPPSQMVNVQFLFLSYVVFL